MQEGKDLVTLVTCTPLGINSQRILVTGSRIIPTPTDLNDAASRRPDVPRFPWWALIIVGATIAAIWYVRSDIPRRTDPRHLRRG